MKYMEFICAEDAPLRADLLISRTAGISRAAAAAIIANGGLIVDGATAVKSLKIRPGSRITLTLPEPEVLDLAAEEIPLDIVYEDDDLLVVNKPKGMVVHPAPGNRDGTLVNALLAHCGDSLSGINGVLRPGIVHRIDKDTSGLLIVAKSDRAHTGLAKQIKEHTFDRCYEAVVYGNIKEDGSVCAPVGRHPVKRRQMAVTDRNSKPAVTHFTVLQRYEGFCHLRLRLETGRTHQIRVHMAYIGHPVAGDPLYGPKKVITSLNGQCLHAKRIGFDHPVTGERLTFESALPDYFTAFLKRLKPL
ncbi:MAG: RluA family pseudouridine synthase [Candidatus Howiella sp.]|jgi:23S rRNA pseudouridine1911/1915/1917 synthase